MAREAQCSALARSLFIDAVAPGDRLWATDLALRCRAAAAVIADGSGFDLGATRRLQLAAEAGGTPCLLARPPWERCVLSAAATRWLVRSRLSGRLTEPTYPAARCWTVELLRCKGVQPAQGPRMWAVERDHATRDLRVVADVLDRPGEAEVVRARRTG